MPGFLDLPTEIRLTIYDYVLPDKDVWVSSAVRGGLNFLHSEEEALVRAKIHEVAQVNRKIRREALSVMFSRIEFNLMLFGQNLQYPLAWLGSCCLPHMDAIRNLHIVGGEELNYLDVNFVFNMVSKLSNVSLQLSLDLEVLAVADSPPRMAFKHMHGFTKASVSGFDKRKMTNCPRHWPRTQETSKRGANLEERFKNAITKMTSPCPGKRCRVHPRRSRDKAISSIEIIWFCKPYYDFYCMACICDEFFTLWKQGPKSIFTPEVPRGMIVDDGAVGTT